MIKTFEMVEIKFENKKGLAIIHAKPKRVTIPLVLTANPYIAAMLTKRPINITET